jgi:hypothetical protein
MTTLLKNKVLSRPKNSLLYSNILQIRLPDVRFKRLDLIK